MWQNLNPGVKSFKFNEIEQKNQRKVYIEELDKWNLENTRVETIDSL